jgi:tRNA-specific 2-thiouridylase
MNSATQVVVAMSGGVDSSVAAILISRSGIPAIGVSMQVWDYRNGGGCSSRATCCAPSDFMDARNAASQAGIPYYVVDFEESFQKEVISKFVDSYAAGETPNPCIDCNNRVKFKELRKRAAAMGCSHVATGHYARIEASHEGYKLLRGVDRSKDQSYFLYAMNQHELASTLFPVGHLTKAEVRGIAREAGLSTAEKAESQDICFVSGSVQDFVAKRIAQGRSGLIRRVSGEIIGTHEGIHRFTVGQRRGLSIGGGHGSPLYVLAKQLRFMSVKK